MLIRLDTVSLAFGSRPLLDHVELQVDEGERVCVVGRNGEGKSSLLRLVARSQAPDDGAVWVRPGARVAFLVQDLDAVEDAKVIEIVAGGLTPDAGESWERLLGGLPNGQRATFGTLYQILPYMEQGNLYNMFDRRRSYIDPINMPPNYGTLNPAGFAQVPTYICPSTPGAQPSDYGPYFATIGLNRGAFNAPRTDYIPIKGIHLSLIHI